MTGSIVLAATMPGRCAAPPAPAMMTLSPRSTAVSAYSNIKSGVLCARHNLFLIRNLQLFQHIASQFHCYPNPTCCP